MTRLFDPAKRHQPGASAGLLASLSAGADSAQHMILDLTICCAYSKALPWGGHFVGRCNRGERGDRFTIGSATTGRGARRYLWCCRERGQRGRMGSIGRYIFRHTFGAFLLVCASLTALMWITQALRDVDLMTNQGQSVFVFVGITSLLIPLLIMIIAPIALMVAVGYIVQPGRFTRFDQKLTLHIRQREANGQLLGVFIDDQRDDKERVTLLAERGNIVKTGRGTFLVLEIGSAQRHQAGRPDPAIVLFDSYGFDLSELMPGPRSIKYSTRERYL